MVSLSDQEREQIALSVWGAGSRTRSPLLPILLSEIDQIVARHVAAALERAAMSIEHQRYCLQHDWRIDLGGREAYIDAAQIVRAQIHN